MCGGGGAGGGAGTLADVGIEVLWPAMCVAHEVLAEAERKVVVALVHVMMPMSVEELALLCRHPPDALRSIVKAASDLRLIALTPQGLVYVLPAVRDAIAQHLHRRLAAVSHGGLMRADDFYSEAWVRSHALLDLNSFPLVDLGFSSTKGNELRFVPTPSRTSTHSLSLN